MKVLVHHSLSISPLLTCLGLGSGSWGHRGSHRLHCSQAVVVHAVGVLLLLLLLLVMGQQPPSISHSFETLTIERHTPGLASILALLGHCRGMMGPMLALGLGSGHSLHSLGWG